MIISANRFWLSMGYLLLTAAQYLIEILGFIAPEDVPPTFLGKHSLSKFRYGIVPFFMSVKGQFQSDISFQFMINVNGLALMAIAVLLLCLIICHL